MRESSAESAESGRRLRHSTYYVRLRSYDLYEYSVYGTRAVYEYGFAAGLQKPEPEARVQTRLQSVHRLIERVIMAL